jgi:CBS domain containing-hemolysin-like protein
MSTLGHVPSEGESFTAFQHHFEVVDMDGNRIDKVWVSRVQSNANIAQQ